MSETNEHSVPHEHVDPLKSYLVVFGLLLALLLLTVWVYHFDMGVLNTVVAIIIACVKTSLVMLVFMHLRHGTKLTWVIASTGFIWLCIMITFLFSDYLSRDLPDPLKASVIPVMPVAAETPHQAPAP